MIQYSEKYSDCREYIVDAETWLCDAEAALDMFLAKAEPETAEAEIAFNRIDNLRKVVRWMNKAYHSAFTAVTQGLPERE